MPIELLTWVFAGAFAAMVVLLVWVFLAYLRPAMTSVAWLFIRAKRKNKPIVALDDGSRWVFKVAEKVAPGILMPKDEIPIEITPKSIKWGGGVQFGAGELFRSKVANTKMVDFFAQAERGELDNEKLVKKIATIESAVNQELLRMENGHELPKKDELREMADNLKTKTDELNGKKIKELNNDYVPLKTVDIPARRWDGEPWKE